MSREDLRINDEAGYGQARVINGVGWGGVGVGAGLAVIGLVFPTGGPVFADARGFGLRF